MAKKTKKEKIIADLRRKMALLETTPIVSQENQNRPIIVKPSTLQFPISHQTITPQPSSFYVNPPQLIRKDLTKTILLSILALSLEIGLYFLFEGKIGLPVINFGLPISLSFS